jgi:hypothetical protein
MENAKKKRYSAPALSRHGDVYEITATIGTVGQPDNITGITRTSLSVLPGDKYPRQWPPIKQT